MHLLGDEASAAVRLVEDATALALAAVLAHEATGDSGLLASAISILDHAEHLFAEDGVWYMTPADTELPLRPREQHDSPTPTGASLAVARRTAPLAMSRASRASAYSPRTRSRAWCRSLSGQRSAAGTALAAMCELLGERVSRREVCRRRRRNLIEMRPDLVLYRTLAPGETCTKQGAPRLLPSMKRRPVSARSVAALGRAAARLGGSIMKRIEAIIRPERRLKK